MAAFQPIARSPRSRRLHDQPLRLDEPSLEQRRQGAMTVEEPALRRLAEIVRELGHRLEIGSRRDQVTELDRGREMGLVALERELGMACPQGDPYQLVRRGPTPG